MDATPDEATSPQLVSLPPITPQRLTIPHLLQRVVEHAPQQPAILTIADDEQLHATTWEEVAGLAVRAALALQTQGVAPGSHVAHVQPNGLPWIVIDLALHLLRAVHVPLDHRSPAAELESLVAHSEAEFLVAQRPLGSAKHIRPEEVLKASGVWSHEQVYWFATLCLPKDLATVVYTSGTSGTPRGVMLSQKNLASNASALVEAVGSDRHETRLAMLPFHHAYARTCDIYSWLVRGSTLALSRGRETILRDCQLVRPTVISSVPYFFEKVVKGVQASGGSLGAAMGGNIRRCYVGGAAVAPRVAEAFAAEAIPLLAGYGLTEASPVVTVQRPGECDAATVGPPLPGTELQVDQQGELLVRGPGVMQGYWNDAAATAQVLDDNNWLRTGDLATIDERGHVRIAGRAKELLVLSTGKNVPPTTVESRLTADPRVEQALVVGEGQRFVAVLIVPAREAVRGMLRQAKAWVFSRRGALRHRAVREAYADLLSEATADLPPEFRPGAFLLIGRGFLPEHGELTAKLSLRRDVIAANFARELEALYREPRWGAELREHTSSRLDTSGVQR